MDPFDIDLLDTVLRPSPPPFALLRREDGGSVEVFSGEVEVVERLADLPLPDGVSGPQTLALVPYRQVAERGFAHIDDGTPLSALRITRRDRYPLAEVVRRLPAAPVVLADTGFDVTDEEYARIVAAVLREEIGRGEGSNFVIHRVYSGQVAGPPLAAALAVYRRLLAEERGTYWTFLVHTGDRTLVGATPERHVSVDGGLLLMNPISGTFREPGDRAGLLRFLADPKEIDELFMVLDEELKMMATVADGGGQVLGPYLKEMAHLVHTEYLLAGRAGRDVRDILRDTMFAPTVVGSPIENACRVVARHEGRGRGYYGGVLALLGRDPAGLATVDAPILIRTAEIDHSGRLRVPVGATLVRGSTAEGEVAETYAKAAGVLAALGVHGARASLEPYITTPGLAADPEIQEVLARRNATLARFWLDPRDLDSRDTATCAPLGGLAGRRVLIADAEDTFTGMLAHLMRALGLLVDVRPCTSPGEPDSYDLVVAGPGPGDPADLSLPRMAALRALVDDRLTRGRPLLAVCLGHQVLASALGLPLYRKDVPYQGVQREIDFFGRPERVGFYSTFAARCPEPAGGALATRYGAVELSRDPATGDVAALRGPTFAGVQFHPESVLSEHGIDLVRELVTGLLPATVTPV
jgi:phenazine biosynthesis protein phzE